MNKRYSLYILSLLAITSFLFVSGFGEKPVVIPVNKLPSPQIENIVDEPIVLPKEVLAPDFPAQRKVIHVEDLTIAEFKGDDVFAEDDLFFVVDGIKKQLVHLEQGSNDLYLINVQADGKRRISKKKVLYDRKLPDVASSSPDAAAIRYLCLLKIVGPYTDEGGLFLPDNAVSAEEFSQVLNQVVQVSPRAISFSRDGQKDVVTLESALRSLERNFGEPVQPWPAVLGTGISLLPETPLTRVMLARLLMNVPVVSVKVESLKKEYSL